MKSKWVRGQFTWRLNLFYGQIAPVVSNQQKYIIEIWAELPRQGELYLADRGNYARTKLKLLEPYGV